MQHNYGPAGDVPQLLRLCASADEGEALTAAAELENLLYHQGGWVCSAASAALPYVLGLAEDPHVHQREFLLRILRQLAELVPAVDPQFLDPAWVPAMTGAQPAVMGLLVDDDPAVRREGVALAVAAAAPGAGLDASDVLASLLQRWSVEPDRVTRLDLLVGLGRVLTIVSSLATYRAAVEARSVLETQLAQGDRQSRLAVVHGLAAGDPQLPIRHVPALIDATADPGADDWILSTWGGGTRETVVHAAAGLLHDDPVTLRTFTVALTRAASHDVDRVIAAMAQMGWQLARWRDADPELVGLLSDLVDSQVPEIRWRAVHLLGCLPEAAVQHVNRIAALLGDTAVTASPRGGAVADAAAWALLRMEDVRFLPRLLQSLEAANSRTNFSTAHSHRDTSSYLFTTPGLVDTMELIVEPGTVVVEKVARLLRDSAAPFAVPALSRVLAGWGAAASAAVPVLESLLGRDPREAAQAAQALGAIGPAAVDAAGRLRHLAVEGPEKPATVFAWAHWRTTGDPGLALAATADLSAVTHLPPVLRYLADLGPIAAQAEPGLRLLLAHSDDWVRVEAAYALWKVTGRTTEALPVLLDLASMLTGPHTLPVATAALAYFRNDLQFCSRGGGI